VSRQQTAPPPPAAYPPQTAESQQPRPPARIPVTPVPPGGVSDADLDFVNTHRPILSETGRATWYTAPYKGRKAANGEVFSDSALTAAHRTLPMGSLVTVTNLRTGQSAAMRITDRGPFVDGRILDLTIASAKATGIYRVGTAEVRLDVYQTPKPIETGGRWCVQIGAFKSEHDAEELKSQLLREYPNSNVIEFPGQDSYWVRIRPKAITASKLSSSRTTSTQRRRSRGLPHPARLSSSRRKPVPKIEIDEPIRPTICAMNNLCILDHIA